MCMHLYVWVYGYMGVGVGVGWVVVRGGGRRWGCSPLAYLIELNSKKD
jgi:hypothetical protein